MVAGPSSMKEDMTFTEGLLSTQSVPCDSIPLPQGRLALDGMAATSTRLCPDRPVELGAPPGYFKVREDTTSSFFLEVPPPPPPPLPSATSDRCPRARAGKRPPQMPDKNLEEELRASAKLSQSGFLAGEAAQTMKQVLAATSKAYMMSQPPSSVLVPDSILLPSLGSIAHDCGTCHPCHYAHARPGCHIGKLCGLCHYPHPKFRQTHPALPVYRL
mmetsp:Transcript_56763/g.122686  ORF Transcript_56763/g.122686 Transcript_56763/m.122686 type:complete len:216 (-) Transcript_56763:648-1295(-)